MFYFSGSFDCLEGLLKRWGGMRDVNSIVAILEKSINCYQLDDEEKCLYLKLAMIWGR